MRGASRLGRVVLAIGGLGTLAVAAFPLPADGTADSHVVAAGFAFGALGLWPALATRRGAVDDRLLARRYGVPASIVLLALVFVFLGAPAAKVGLYERIAAAAQALWPLCVVAAAGVQRSELRRARGSGHGG